MTAVGHGPYTCLDTKCAPCLERRLSASMAECARYKSLYETARLGLECIAENTFERCSFSEAHIALTTLAMYELDHASDL